MCLLGRQEFYLQLNKRHGPTVHLLERQEMNCSQKELGAISLPECPDVPKEDRKLFATCAATLH
jgi:hypothetical protein